jgi:1,4-alpha-glucan branching enzyme
LNNTVRSLHPGVITIAEESTTWPRVTHAIADGGLGFTFKWNMGWMHDTLDFFRVDPLFRRGVHDKLTFALMYEYSERFMNPLSHDEVVHLKRSLLEKMPGDLWQKFANLRALIAYSVTRPGKSLFFMGTELAPHREWNHDASLEWSLQDDPRRKGLSDFMKALGALYHAHSCFWRRDHEPSGFSWIDVADKEQSVLSYARFDGATHAIVVLNLTPVPRPAYRIGAPGAGSYAYALNSDAREFGGSGYEIPETVQTEAMPYHGFANSVELVLPPLSIVVLTHIAPLTVDDVASVESLGVLEDERDPAIESVHVAEESALESTPPVLRAAGVARPPKKRKAPPKKVKASPKNAKQPKPPKPPKPSKSRKNVDSENSE